MNLILILLTCYLYSIQVIDSRMYRVMVDDEFYPYTIDKSVPSYLEYFDLDNLIFEIIDDDGLKLGGYALLKKSFDSRLPLQFFMRSQYLENSVWQEGQLRLIVPNACAEFLDPSKFFYNVTKLWTNCPPQKGDKWVIDSQTLNIQFNLTPSFSRGPWRGYFLFAQGVLSNLNKFGVAFQVEMVDII